MKEGYFKKFYKIIQALSLDIALGSMAGGSLAVYLTGARMPAAWWFVLPAAVWIIYSTDHLADAYRVGDAAHTFRHRFHHRHFVPILAMTAIVSAATLYLTLFHLPVEIVMAGLILSLFVLLHLILSFFSGRFRFPKEISVALVYSVGIWFAPLILATRNLDIWTLLAFTLFFTAALLNLLLYSLFESGIDAMDGHHSLALSLGRPRARIWIRFLALFSIFPVVGNMLYGYPRLHSVFLVLSAMNLIPECMMEFEPFFRKGERYRIIGDGLFLLPALPLIISRFWLT